MTTLSERYLKTGGDPRTLPDYGTLRDELGKLSHPARPDVNWRYAEQLCLALFEHNGVELQTAAWYTLVRTRLSGLAGLNEGLAILDALIGHQWGSLWPQPVHSRVAILSGLSRRLQQMMRTLPVSYGDLGQLYRAEQQLNRLNEVLQRLELKHLSQFDALAALMHTSAVRLENSDAAAGPAAPHNGVVLSAPVERADGGSRLPSVPWVYVAQADGVGEKSSSLSPSAFRRWPFTAGMRVMLLLGSAVIAGWHLLQRADPLLSQLQASLSPLPEPLSAAQAGQLALSPLPAERLIRQTQQQLDRLSGLPPDWSLAYGQRLVRQALALSPHSPTSLALAQAWQQQLDAAALPQAALEGWQQGMDQLQQLTAKLNALDGQRGRYMTVSELKSVLYNATQAFNRALPAEEQLRRYALNPADIQRRQAEMALQQLQSRYLLLRQAGAVSDPLPTAEPIRRSL